MPFIVNPKPSVMTFGYEKCRCEFTMQSVQEITKLSITKVFPLKPLCKDSHNVFCRLADPTAHREAITSRPAYMGIMGRIVESGRKRIIHLTSTHAESELIQRARGTVAAFFRWLKSTAEHLDEKTRWYVVLRCAFHKLLMPEQPLGAVISIQ